MSVVESPQNCSESIRLRFLCISAAIRREREAVLKPKDIFSVNNGNSQAVSEYMLE